MLSAIRRFGLAATCLVTLLVTAPVRGHDAASTPPADAAKEGAQAAAAAFHAALEAGNRDAALALLLPDVTIFESGVAELSRDAYAAEHLAADIEFVRATSEEIVAREALAADGLAVVMTRSRTTGTFRDKPVDLDGTETLVLRQTADGWRIVHIHWSSHRRPAS